MNDSSLAQILRLRIARQIGYFSLGSSLTLFYAQIVHAQTAPAQTAATPIVQNPYSIETIVAAVIAAAITVVFLRNMYLVLTYASATYGLVEDEAEEINERENNALLWGAFAWVVGSALVIAAYGWGWSFLYVGPIICLLGPLVPIVAMNLDLKRYREILSANRAHRQHL